MSISTQGGEQRRPSTVSTGRKSPGGKAGDAKTAAAGKGAGGKAPAGKGGGGKGPRRPVPPVKVNPGRAWGPIALFAAVALVAVGIIGYGGWAVYQGARSWEDRAAEIEGMVNWRDRDKQVAEGGQHKPGPLTYRQSPAVGGEHNNDWQNCMGDVYDAPIAQEHAVHSLEHGAVWITYRSGLPADQVEKLAAKVRGKEKMMMSPYDDLDSTVSMQAWGYQLKVDDVDDPRIDEFIKVLRVNASIEGPNAVCSGGITATGTTPRDLQQNQMPQQ